MLSFRSSGLGNRRPVCLRPFACTPVNARRVSFVADRLRRSTHRRRAANSSALPPDDSNDQNSSNSPNDTSNNSSRSIPSSSSYSLPWDEVQTKQLPPNYAEIKASIQQMDNNQLQTALGVAIAAEDYALAAQIKDRLQQKLSDSGSAVLSQPLDWRPLGVPEWLADRAERVGFMFPTEVQRRAAPVILSGSDTIIASETGSGKTAAFLVPALAQLDYPPDLFPEDLEGPQLLLLVPSFELGVQACMLLYKLWGGNISSRTPGDPANMFSYTGPPGIKVRGVLNDEELQMAVSGARYLRGVHAIVATPDMALALITLKDSPLSFQDLRVIIADEMDALLDAYPASFAQLMDAAVTRHTPSSRSNGDQPGDEQSAAAAAADSAQDRISKVKSLLDRVQPGGSPKDGDPNAAASSSSRREQLAAALAAARLEGLMAAPAAEGTEEQQQQQQQGPSQQDKLQEEPDQHSPQQQQEQQLQPQQPPHSQQPLQKQTEVQTLTNSDVPCSPAMGAAAADVPAAAAAADVPAATADVPAAAADVPAAVSDVPAAPADVPAAAADAPAAMADAPAATIDVQEAAAAAAAAAAATLDDDTPMPKPQVVLVGATVSNDDISLAVNHGWVEEPVVVRVGEAGSVPAGLKHRALVVNTPAKRLGGLVISLRKDLSDALAAADAAAAAVPAGSHQLDAGPHLAPVRVIMFASSEAEARAAADPLRSALWGDHMLSVLLPSTGAEPIKALHAFRDRVASMLLATPSAARGLDLPAVSHVYSLGLPLDATEYVHKAGRAGRIGSTSGGDVCTVVTHAELQRFRDMVEGELGLSLEVVELDQQEKGLGLLGDDWAAARADLLSDSDTRLQQQEQQPAKQEQQLETARKGLEDLYNLL